MYYVQHGESVIVMLGGGDKSNQQADIRRAIALAKSLVSAHLTTPFPGRSELGMLMSM